MNITDIIEQSINTTIDKYYSNRSKEEIREFITGAISGIINDNNYNYITSTNNVGGN